MSTRCKGRRKPPDWDHVTKHPFSAHASKLDAPVNVEVVLNLPPWHWTHDQGQQGSCTGHGLVMERAITNTRQNITGKLPWPRVRRYNPLDPWQYAKDIDEYPDTQNGDDNGTSVRAVYEIARTKGLERVRGMEIVNSRPQPIKMRDWDLKEGVAEYSWATTVDEMRQALVNKMPVTIGINWYPSFDSPVPSVFGPTGNVAEWKIDVGSQDKTDEGHCLVVYGASDKRQAFKLKNSWGRQYPLVWLPYTVMSRLLSEEGEAALIVDL